MDDEQPILGFRVGVFNWRLKRARESAGLTMAQLSERTKIDLTTLYAIQGLRQKPTESQADRLSAALVIPVDDLFPGLIDELISRIGTVEIPLTEQQVRRLTTDRDEEDRRLSNITVRQALLPFLSQLSRRQKQLLVQYTAADHNDRPSLSELGREMGLDRERVRQLEAQLLARIRRTPRLTRDLASAL
jgi:transcriptional regulator with XRE-family HTH domain